MAKCTPLSKTYSSHNLQSTRSLFGTWIWPVNANFPPLRFCRLTQFFTCLVSCVLIRVCVCNFYFPLLNGEKKSTSGWGDVGEGGNHRDVDLHLTRKRFLYFIRIILYINN